MQWSKILGTFRPGDLAMLYKQLAEQAMDKVDVAANLTYLIRADAYDIEAVVTYATKAEVELIELTRLLRSLVVEVKSWELAAQARSQIGN